jgi:hypothetical protein
MQISPAKKFPFVPQEAQNGRSDHDMTYWGNPVVLTPQCSGIDWKMATNNEKFSLRSSGNDLMLKFSPCRMVFVEEEAFTDYIHADVESIGHLYLNTT